jgi:hypothetical protein
MRAFSGIKTARSQHFRKITLHFPNLQGETGSPMTASTAIVPLSWVLETQQHRPAASAFRSVISWLRTELLCQSDQSGMTYLRLVVPLYRIL